MWKITPICCGVLEGIPKPLVTYGHGFGQFIDVPLIAWVLVNGDAAVLVDTGASNPELARVRHHRTLNQSGGRTLLAELERVGVRPEQIRSIVQTHLHWDHCAGAALIPEVPIFVQREEVRFAIDPPPTQFHPYESPLLGFDPPWLAEMRRFVLLEGAADLDPGLSVMPVPGHTDGSQAVLVQTDQGRYCIAGDLLDTYENWSGRLPGWPDWLQGIPAGILTSVEQWYASVRQVRALKVPIIPAHDWAVLKAGPIG